MTKEELMHKAMSLLQDACGEQINCETCLFDRYCKVIEEAGLETPLWWEFTETEVEE